jgi:hypothetical protein
LAVDVGRHNAGSAPPWPPCLKTYSRYRIITRLLLPILHLLVFGPAMAALFLYGLAYQFSIEAAVRDAFQYIETTAKASKNAPPGYPSLPAGMKAEGTTPKFTRCDTNVLKNYFEVSLIYPKGSRPTCWASTGYPPFLALTLKRGDLDRIVFSS